MNDTNSTPAQEASLAASLLALVQGNKIIRHGIAVAAGYLAHRFCRDSGDGVAAISIALTILAVIALSFWSAWSKSHDVNSALAATKAFTSALLQQTAAAAIGYIGQEGGDMTNAAAALAAINYALSAAHRPDAPALPKP